MLRRKLSLPLLAGLTGFAAVMGSPGLAQNLNFAASELPRPEWPQQVHAADMDGDGRLDLVLPFWSVESGRQLHIFLQQADHRFPTQPSRVVDIRSEIVAVAIADLRPEPGSELLLFTGSTVFSLSTAIASYSGNLRRLFDWPLSSAVPDPQLTRFFDAPVDHNNDGFVDLLLPGVNEYGWFTGAADEQFELRQRFSTHYQDEDNDSEAPSPPAGRISSNISFNAQDGLLVDVRVVSGSPFEDFLQFSADGADSLLDISHWMPAAIMAPLRVTDSHDLIYLNGPDSERGQVHIKTMQTDGNLASQPDWQSAIDMRGEFQLVDVDGDGLTDIVRLSEEGNSWTVSFYRNRGAQFDFSSADQVMRFSGYDLRVSAVPLQMGEKPVLSISYYTIPVVAAVRDASIARSTLLFGASSAQGLFNNRPDYLLEESFSASSVRGLASPVVLDADLDADGRRDALYLTPEGTVAARRIDTALRFSATPFWQYVPTRSVSGFRVLELNGDGRPDLILEHSNAITILVSAP